MSNSKHVAALNRGVNAFNEWRRQHLTSTGVLALGGAKLGKADLGGVDLSKANLNKADLSNANLGGADLTGANLREANLNGACLLGVSLNRANLSGATFIGANLRNANLVSANLVGADLSKAELNGANLLDANLRKADLTNSHIAEGILARANLTSANLSGANLRNAQLAIAKLNKADLSGTILNGATLRSTNLGGATMFHTWLGDLDLSATKGLDSVIHHGPSSLGIDTALKSQGKIPEVFLRGCGVPDIFIQYVDSLANQPIQYYSCFISYSSRDQQFAQRLYNDLQANNVRCWFAPEDIKGGKKLHDQIDDAIRVYDKLLLILSSHSMASGWVKTEIAKARKREKAEKRQMLFPVRLVDYDTLEHWECFDADAGTDSASEIRAYFIPDFTEWKTNHDKYQIELNKLIRDLKAVSG